MGFWPTAELHVFEKAENPGFKKSLGNIYKKVPNPDIQASLYSSFSISLALF